MNWWNQSVPEIIQSLSVDIEKGLSSAVVQERRARLGPNALAEQKGSSPVMLFLEQFADFIVWVLIGAALVSGFLQEWIDALAIITIVILNAILGFVQEFRAEKSLAALRRLSSPNAKVIRDGQRALVAAADIVPGDLAEIEAGDNIPADCRVVWHTANFAVQEASLTGESAPVLKSALVIDKQEVPLGDRVNLLFMGTAATAGKARALVVETGMKTELGRIAGMIQSARKEDTPLQKKLERFGKWLVYLCGILVAIVFALGLWRGIQQTGSLTRGLFVEMFLTAVSLAVAAIPEGLPAVVTIALALGLQRMVKRNALIRKLPSVETLGCASVICSDKTGTLTRNEMTVQAIYTGKKLFAVDGIGYAPDGNIAVDGKTVDIAREADLGRCLLYGALCNGSQLIQKDGVWKIVGDPTEGALLTVAAKASIFKESSEDLYPFVQEIPFDSDRKMMTMVRRNGTGEYIAITKGAPDVLIKKCSRILERNSIRDISDDDQREILKINDDLSGQALRVLAIAFRPFSSQPVSYDAAEVEKEMVFVGFAAMIDPAREEVKKAIAECKTAGIKTVMITGDHQNTAVAIARSLGFFGKDDQAVTGEQLDRMDDETLARAIERTPVYARVAPEHKLRIVRAWRKKGHVVAMTGDGVNDAPAVKEADIGVAMGITGTDVTKEVSDMVVTDDNFASIVSAVEEGRGIYDNIQKFIHYLLSCNAGEIMVMFFSSLIGMPLPLLPVQILWINLVTDGLPALALGVDPVDKKIMRRMPRSMTEPVVTRTRVVLMLCQGFVISLCALFAFSYIYYLEGRHSVLDVLGALFTFDFKQLVDIFSVPEEVKGLIIARARTMGFVVLAFSQDFHSYNCRSNTESLFKIGVFSNMKLIGATTVSIILNMSAIYTPFLNTALGTVPLTGIELFLVLIFASTPLWVMEIYKAIRKLLVKGKD